MELILEFTNHDIDLTECTIKQGSIYVEKSIRGKMPEGAYQNGIVINTNSVAQAVKELLKEHQIRTRKAVLCISGMDVIRKEIKIPRGSEKHTRGLLENELNKAEALKNGYIFDYIPSDMSLDSEQDRKNFQSYSVYLLPEELIHNYQTTFKRAGLNLERVVPVNHSMERLSELLLLKDKKGLTILVNAEENGANLLLSGSGIKDVYQSIEAKEENGMEENMFIVSAVRQLQASDSPKDRVLERMAESISKLVQFQSQANAGIRVEQILIYGSLAMDREFITRVEERCQIPAKRCMLPKDKVRFSSEAGEDFYAFHGIGTRCGRLYGKKKELSFLNIQGTAAYVTIRERIPLLAGLACILALAVFYGVLTAGNSRLESDIDTLNAEIAGIEKQPEYIRKKEVQEQLTKLNAYNENCGICIALIEKAVRLTPETFSGIDALVPPNITIKAYGYEDKTVTLSCTSTYQDGPADFARILTDAKLFQDVKYTGFSAVQDVEGITYYTFSLVCSD